MTQLPPSLQKKLAKNPHHRKRQAERHAARKKGKTISPKIDPTTGKEFGK
jgi:hypothetical protein